MFLLFVSYVANEDCFISVKSTESDVLFRDMVLSPLHHSAVHGLNSSFPAFGNTVRLLSRWASAHMLSGI